MVLAGFPIWKALGAVLAVLGLLVAIYGSFAYALKYGESRGHAECEIKVIAAQNEAAIKAQKAIKAEISKLQKIEDEIQQTPDSDNRPVSPVLRDQLIRMRHDGL